MWLNATWTWGVSVAAPSVAIVCNIMPAYAQMLPPDESLVQFGRNTAVRERQIPGYEPRAVRIGSLTLSPSVEVSAQYSDNVQALATAPINDVFARITPSAQLRSDWSRRSLALSASAAIDRFATQARENTETVDASLYGIQQFGTGGRIRAIARFQQGRESRESQNAFALTQRPILYSTATVGLGLSYRFSKVLVAGEAGVTRANYLDGQLTSGALLDQDYRDGDVLRLRGRIEFAHSSAIAMFVQATRDKVTYRDRSPAGSLRDSTSVEFLGGIRFELPFPARGEIGVGYVRANYRDPGFRDFSGLAINSSVTFFPTQLTTITVSAQRSVNESGIATSRGYVALVGGVQVDHELLRSLIISANLRIERDRFNGIDRTDRRSEFGVAADYRLTRVYSLRARYDHLGLSSRGADQYKSFDRNRFLIGLTVRI